MLAKVSKRVSTQLMAKVFPFKDPVSYNLRQIPYFEKISVKIEHFGQSLMSIDPKLWKLVQPNVRKLETVTAFKLKPETLVDNTRFIYCKLALFDCKILQIKIRLTSFVHYH